MAVEQAAHAAGVVNDAVLTDAERRFRVLLRALAAILVLAGLAYFLGPLAGPFRDLYLEPPFVLNSVTKVTVLGVCCLYVSGDVRRRMGLAAIVIFAHFVSVAAMLVALAFGHTGGAMSFGSLGSASVGSVLWGAIGLDGVITLVVVVFYLLARRSQPAADDLTKAKPTLLPIELWLRRFAVIAGAWFVVSGAGYELGGLLDSTRGLFLQWPFVTNSVVMSGTLAMLCFYVARDVRAHLSLWGVAACGLVLSGIVGLAYLTFLHTGYTRPFFGHQLNMADILWGLVGVHLLAAVPFFALYRATWKQRYGLRYFTPIQYRALLAAAGIVIDGPAVLTPEQIAQIVDQRVALMTARRTWLYRVAMLGLQAHPLLYLKPPFSELSPRLRYEHVRTHFQKVAPTHNWVFNLPQVTIRMAQQLCFAAYYNHEDTWESIGYVPYSKRPGNKRAERLVTAEHDLEVELPADLTGETLESEICIVGTGAGGAILAYELAAKGHDVLMLERGRYVEPRHFSEDEIQMVSELYADGVMEQSEDFRFTILQGSCVGGSTTVNNSVCFDPPAGVLARWNDVKLHDAGLDLAKLNGSITDVRKLLSVTPQGPDYLNPSGAKYLQGVANLAVSPSVLEVGPVEANIKDCIGCGYCNIGCAYGAKLSMLQTTLPWAQKQHPGKVRIVAECEVERIRAESGAPAQATDVRARLSDGRRITVKAEKFILSAGTVASSYLLMRSGLGRGLPVGKQVCFNMGAPLTAEFEHELDSYAGLQISHFGLPQVFDGFAFETWFNPPVSQAENMPGWFGDHFQNMRNFSKLMAVGVIVGTAGNASIYKSPIGGAGVRYIPEQQDLTKLAEGLKLLGEILFAAGAKRVMLNTWDIPGAQFTDSSQLVRLKDVVMKPAWMSLGTGHPQGGNAISEDPARGVIGPDFRVHGYRNLYVCDASVFPSSLTVNPQLTVMSLAHYAGGQI
ncbi:MAG TPA: GMC family oxidoreductase [Solirubrobacteraceae bacterium]|jgi:choline dehydrogenase-like flavoprotein